MLLLVSNQKGEILILAILIFFFHTPVFAEYSGYSSDINHDDEVSYESFVQRIEESQTQTLEGSLELLPDSFFEHYVLMYRSRSLQQSSYLHPRAILFGKSSRFILTFNGNPKHRGYNNLEMIQYREKEHRWEFREIEFIEGEKPRFSNANPAKCLECHQSPKRQGVDPRPNWEPYNFWPGAYASVDERIRPELKPAYEKYLTGYGAMHSTMNRFLPEDFLLVDEQAQEETMLEHFESKIKPQHPRYKRLDTFKTRDPLSFTKSLVILNMYRVARLIREELGDRFDAFVPTLLGLGGASNMASSKDLAFRCTDLYIPETIQSRLIPKAQEIHPLKEKEYLRPSYALGWEFGFAAGLEILMHPLGILTDDWSMDFKTRGRFSARDRFTSPHHAATHFRDAAKVVYKDHPAITWNCDELKANSLAQWTTWQNSGLLEDWINPDPNWYKKQNKPLIQRCISCHVNYEVGTQAPWIPFDQPDLLSKKLRESKYPRGTLLDEIVFRVGSHAPAHLQMPPSGLTDTEAVEALLEGLSELVENKMIYPKRR